jgi:hypothetical protein
MMFHSATGSGRGFGQPSGLRGATSAAVVFLLLTAAILVVGGCSRAPAYVDYQATHTLPSDYNAAGSGPTRPLALTGQVVVSADPLWKQYAARTQAFVTHGAGTAAAGPRTGGSVKIAAGKDGPEESAPAHPSRKPAGKKTVKATAKKAGKSATTQSPAGPAGLFPEPVCPEGCIPAPGYKRTTPAPAQSSTPSAQPPAPVPASGASTAAPALSVTPSTALAPGPAGPTSVPGNGKAGTTPASSSASAPPQSPPGTSAPASAPAVRPNPPALPASSTPSGVAAPEGGRLLPPVGGQQAPERDPALAPPGSSGLGYVPAPPPQ